MSEIKHYLSNKLSLTDDITDKMVIVEGSRPWILGVNIYAKVTDTNKEKYVIKLGMLYSEEMLEYEREDLEDKIFENIREVLDTICKEEYVLNKLIIEYNGVELKEVLGI